MMICFSEFRPTRIAWTAAYVALGGLALIPLSGAPAIADDDVQSRRIRIEYAPPKSPEIEPYYQLVMQRKALEKVQELFSPLMLARLRCAQRNAGFRMPGISAPR
jgi:hypothetical protein